ncbi:MAG: hypothetical protein KAR79_03385, partial [Simkaniaceae bacterium]|nr:hypothetical protein [Simkaniaceae bacterium]
MNKLRAIIHLIMLAITPSLLAFPQNHLQHISIVNFESWTPPTTYDEILLMLDELESGEFEKKYSSAQLEQVNEYLITLAREGILPGEFEEEITLEEDIYELMNENNSTFQFDYFTSDEYMLIPATYNGYSNYDIVYCGSFSKSWKKTKKFLKRHKKEIIIGAVVIVAVGAVAIAVVAASSATAAAATAGAAAASSSSSSGSNSDKLESSKTEEKASSSGASNTSSTDTPILQSAMEKQIVSFKENIAREDFFELPKQGEALSI